MLTDVSREMLAASAHEDPLELGKQCGMIQNKNVKVCHHLSLQLPETLGTKTNFHPVAEDGATATTAGNGIDWTINYGIFQNYSACETKEQDRDPQAG